MSMDREDAIDYLENRDIISGVKKYSKAEEAKIKEAMKHGKIYGDPEAECY